MGYGSREEKTHSLWKRERDNGEKEEREEREERINNLRRVHLRSILSYNESTRTYAALIKETLTIFFFSYFDTNFKYLIK